MRLPYRLMLLTVSVSSLSTACLAQSAPPRTVITRGGALAPLRGAAARRDAALEPAIRRLLSDAATLAAQPMIAVTDKQSQLPPSGDRHDYYSLSPYWWPDSTKADGLPYIRRDGITNPESKRDLDQPRLAAMAERVQLFTLAWWVSGDAKWSALAARQLRTWFIDPATRMNPHLRYAQLIRGRTEERGTGLIDARGFIDVVDAVGMLERSPDWTPDDDRALRGWLREYVAWLTTGSMGRKERAAKNNHGSWYAAQLSALAWYAGDTTLVRELANETKARIGWQIGPDGMQAEEMARTRSMHYTAFNAEALSRVAEVARHVDIDLWRYEAPRGGSLAKTIALLAKYAGREAEWPGQQIDTMNRTDLLRVIARARLALGSAVYAEALDRLPREVVARDRSTLLFRGDR